MSADMALAIASIFAALVAIGIAARLLTDKTWSCRCDEPLCFGRFPYGITAVLIYTTGLAMPLMAPALYAPDKCDAWLWLIFGAFASCAASWITISIGHGLYLLFAPIGALALERVGDGFSGTNKNERTEKWTSLGVIWKKIATRY